MRDAYALQLRRQGLTYSQIAEQIARKLTEEAALTGGSPRGYTAMAAHEAVKRAIRDNYREDVQNAAELELERLDDLIRQTMAIAARRHYVVSNTGRIVEGPDGSPLEDNAPRLAAIARLQSLGESRRKLLGLDAPARQRIEVITEDVVDNMIRQLTEELGTPAQDRVPAREAPAS